MKILSGKSNWDLSLFLILFAVGCAEIVTPVLLNQEAQTANTYLEQAKFETCQAKWNIQKRYLVYENFQGNEYCPWQSNWQIGTGLQLRQTPDGVEMEVK